MVARDDIKGLTLNNLRKLFILDDDVYVSLKEYMKVMKKTVFFIIVVFTLSCSNKIKHPQNTDSFFVEYTNELFSIYLPEGWIIDDSKWLGLDSIQNEVDLYNPNDDVVWFHIVKAFFPMRFRNINDAAEFAKTARSMSCDSVLLLDEIDSISIDGVSTKLLVFENFVGKDTVIQKQFVTYIEESHILLYINANCLYANWKMEQEIENKLINNLVIKRHVQNPLEKKYKPLLYEHSRNTDR